MDDMNDIGSRAQASRHYEMLKAFIDLKNFESALDKMINSVLSLKWMTRGCELVSLNHMIS